MVITNTANLILIHNHNLLNYNNHRLRSKDFNFRLILFKLPGISLLVKFILKLNLRHHNHPYLKNQYSKTIHYQLDPS